MWMLPSSQRCNSRPRPHNLRQGTEISAFRTSAMSLRAVLRTNLNLWSNARVQALLALACRALEAILTAALAGPASHIGAAGVVSIRAVVHLSWAQKTSSGSVLISRASAIGGR